MASIIVGETIGAKNRIYGKKSEKLDKEGLKQLGLLFNEAERDSEPEQQTENIRSGVVEIGGIS